MKLRLNRWFGWVLLFALTACGGKSATEGDAQQAGGSAAHDASNPASGATSGGAGNGGATDGGAASGSAADGGSVDGGASATAGAAPVSDACPAERPANGSACNYAGNHQCNYEVDKCSSLGFVCMNGVWLAQSNNDGAALTCANYAEDPRNIPHDGDSCACRGTLNCSFDQCDSSGLMHAVCDNTTWHVTAEPCSDTPCGPNGLRCKVGEACVVRAGPGGGAYQCDADPCAEQSQSLSCDCAGALCHGPSERCAMNGAQIDCICDTC